MSTSRRPSPTPGLLAGLLITLAAVVASGVYVTREISRLRTLQTDIADRHRRDSLQLLRIQNDLNSAGLAMRDMLDNDDGYPLTAWQAQFERIRGDLDDALRRQEAIALAPRTPEQRELLTSALSQFWEAAERIFALARENREDEAREQIRLSLQARQAALATAVARQLVLNYEAEEDTARRVQAIYSDVQRQLYLSGAAVVTTILLTSLYLIRSNRRLFAEMAALADARRDVAQRLITTRESTFGEIARELHDDLGQVLTALGLMIARTVRLAPRGSPLESDLREIGGIAQSALDNVRGLSQTLHPSILHDAGLEETIRWYLSTAPRAGLVEVAYEQQGTAWPVHSGVAIHVYRVLQEALTNVSRHSGADRAQVRLSFEPTALSLEIEDRGRGFDAGRPRAGGAGLGVVTMRERASLIGGSIAFVHPAAGGTVVRLVVPAASARGPERETTVDSGSGSGG
jgi:signal transduction histidine kinase